MDMDQRRSLGERVRRRIGGVATRVFFEGLSNAARLHPQARPEKHGVEVLRDIPYRDTGDDSHLLDVYRPIDRREPLPVVLHIHGGGFRILSKDTHWVMGLAFARRRAVVFNVSYRLAPRHPFPAAIEDVCAAYEWVLDNAARFGGDPSKILVAGESAGANLTTSVVLATTFERPEPFAKRVFERGVVPVGAMPFCGLLHVSEIERYFANPKLHPIVVERMKEVSEAYLSGPTPPHGLDLANPLVVLESGAPPARPLPPFFAPVGTKDPILDDTRRLALALERRSVPCETTYYAGEPHAFHAFVFRQNARRCWSDAYRFVERCVAD